MLTLNDGRKELFQWDIGRSATVNVDCDEIHFSNVLFGKAIPIDVIDGTVKIPNQVLTSGEPVYCWCFVNDDHGAYTKKEMKLDVRKRPKPSDYVYDETEIKTIESVVKQAVQDAVDSGEFKGDRGEPGSPGQPGKDGKDGGYYAPFVVQDSPDSFTLGFEPNGEGMPGVPEFNIDLPVAPATDNPSGASVQPDWSQNDPTAPDYVKNRTHWEETFPPIEWDGSTEGRDSFDATVVGFGVCYKISDEVWTEERLKNSVIATDDGFANYVGIQFEDDIVGVVAAYNHGSSTRLGFVFSAFIAVDLTSVYGFAIPSAGLYFCEGNLSLDVSGGCSFITKPKQFPLDIKFMPPEIARTEKTLSKTGEFPNMAARNDIPLDGGWQNVNLPTFILTNTEDELDDMFSKSVCDAVTLGVNIPNVYIGSMVFLFDDARNAKSLTPTGDCVVSVRYIDRFTVEMKAESLVTKSDYDALEARIKALEG